MRVVLIGGSGFIGSAMVQAWASQHSLTVLTRHPESTRKRLPETVQVGEWNGQTQGAWVQTLAESEVVVNLAGETIAQRWTPEVKQRLFTSRVETTRLLVEAMRDLPQRPPTLLQASAIGIYDQHPETVADEDSPPGKGFLAELGTAWEASARPAESLGVRVCYMRFGIVLGAGGGALERMLTPFKLGVGGPIGSGRQWLSWIHIDDVVKGAQFLMERSDLSGAFNFTAPHPVTMAEFARTLGRVLLRPSFVRTPAFVLRLMFGEMAESLLMGSRVLPKRLMEAGYRFRYPALENALRAVLQA